MNRGLRKELAIIAGLASTGMYLGRKNGWAALVGLAAVGLGVLPSPTWSFNGRSVIITGGSRGLGLVLAEQFLKEGASVTLLARDADELERAQEKLREIQKNSDESMMMIPCDVTRPDELESAFTRSEARFGRMDVVVNNAGSISVGPFQSMQQADFDAQIALHLNAAIHATRLAIPAFKKVGGGRIVNISSIGGNLPVPHMGPYCASKFALAGFSESVTAELAPLNINVTTVYPGMMRTGSPIQAVFKGDHEKEYGWFAAGDVMPGLSVSAASAARKIIEGARHGDAQVSFPMITKIGIIGHAIFPETYALVSRQAARLMPKGESEERKTGADSQQWLERQIWYRPFKRVEERAEKQFNQQEKFDADFNLGVKVGSFF